jgi:hypothetical protein
MSKSNKTKNNTRRDEYEDYYDDYRPVKKDRSEKKLKNLFRSRNVHRIVDEYTDEEINEKY